MSTRHFALAALALGLLLAPRAAWAATNLVGAASEVQTKTLTINIEKYGEFFFSESAMPMTVDAVQLAGGINTTPVSDDLAFMAMANTVTDVYVPATIVLAGPSATNLTADVELDRFAQVDDATFVGSPAALKEDVPSGDNNMILRVRVDPAKYSNSPGGVWSVLLPAGVYSNTTSLVVTMTAAGP